MVLSHLPFFPGPTPTARRERKFLYHCINDAIILKEELDVKEFILKQIDESSLLPISFVTLWDAKNKAWHPLSRCQASKTPL